MLGGRGTDRGLVKEVGSNDGPPGFALESRHFNPHLVSAERQINPPQNVDPSTQHESGRVQKT